MLSTLLFFACAHREAPAPEPQRSSGPMAVVAGAHHGYAALGPVGFAVVDPATGALDTPIAPPPPMDGVHDLSLLNDILVALDATPPGHVALYRVVDGQPALSAGPAPVELSGRVGVSSHHGVLAVSGGGAALSVMTYDGAGVLGEVVGRGAPGGADIVLDSTGEIAFVMGELGEGVYGVRKLRLRAPPEAPELLWQLPIAGADAGPEASRIRPPMAAQVHGSRLLLVSSAGLSVLDMQDPARPTVRAQEQIGVLPVAVAVELDRAYVVGSLPAPALVELDLSDPDRPTVLEIIPLPANAWPSDVSVRKGTVLVAAGPAGVLSFRRREPPDATRAQ